MISRLHGQLIEKIAPTVVIDVHGVGYEVDVPLSTFYQLPALGEPVTLWTHLSVREDAHSLFGFHQRDALQAFRILIKVSGVGPRLALALLSGLEVDALKRCISQEDLATLTRIPGVGKKTAERLIIELRDKLPGMDSIPLLRGALPAARTPAPVPATPGEEAESALLALGYKPAEAQRAVKAVSDDHHETADLVRAALKSLLRQ